MYAEWVEIALEPEQVDRQVDPAEQCTLCRERYPWALLTLTIDAQNRVLILCALCEGKVRG